MERRNLNTPLSVAHAPGLWLRAGPSTWPFIHVRIRSDAIRLGQVQSAKPCQVILVTPFHCSIDDIIVSRARSRGTDAELEVFVGDPRAEEQAAHVGGDLETHQSDLPHRVEHDHLAASTLEVHEAAHETRVIAGRVAADEEQHVALVDVIQRDGGGSRSGDASESDP